MARTVIRKAENEDARRLAEIAYRAWESGILPLLSEYKGTREQERRWLAGVVALSLEKISVVEIDGVVVGWCSRGKWSWGARLRPYIPYLFVMPGFQGNGLGSLLLRRVETILELEGADRVHLETPADNVRVVHFYEKQGYRIVPSRRGIAPVHFAFTRVTLEKTLSPFVGVVEDED